MSSQAVPVELKMEDLDAILKKYTSEVENHLRGATFIAVDREGKLLFFGLSESLDSFRENTVLEVSRKSNF
jgi:hypothetical protein